MFTSYSLKFKLIALCSALALMTGVLGAINFIAKREIVSDFNHVVEINMRKIENLGEMRVAFKQARLRAFRAAIEGIDSKALQEIGSGISKAIDEYEAADKAYLDIKFEEGEDELYREVNNYWDNHKVSLLEIKSLLETAPADGRQRIVEIVNGKFTTLGSIYDPAMDKLTEFHRKEGAKWVAIANASQKKAGFLSLVVGVSMVFLGLIIGFLFSRSLSNTLNDLAKRLSSEAGSVASAANQISESSVESSTALTQTVAAIDEISAMVGKNAENAGRSLEVSSICKMAATRGKGAVDQMLASIDDIGQSNKDIMTQTEQSNQEISSIVKIIAEIGNKTAVINDIVFQTKLLSFNASVEAARAGEHGKGFAVVAEEVGNLAQMSGNAAKEIAQMLEESIAKVERTVGDTKVKLESLISTGRSKIEAGASTARSCGDALDDIVRQVIDLNAIVGEISTASREQAQGVQEISKALGQIDQGMQQNTSVAAQSAAASEDLTNQAMTLDGIVALLAQTVSGKSQIPAAQQSRKSQPVKKPSGKIVKFPEKKAAIVLSTSPRPSKKVIGGEDIPADNDPRFEDI